MGTPTGRTTLRIDGTGRGSDYWGGCERCGGRASEIFVVKALREYVRQNGELYGQPHAVSYGHKTCLERDYPQAAQGGEHG